MATDSRVWLDDERCIGCGLCEENLPDVFSMGDFVARLRLELVPEALHEELEIAARDCPVDAISILPASGHSPHHHDEKGQNEEKDGEIGENNRKHGDTPDLQDIKPDDTEGLEGREHDFTVVRNRPDDD